MQFRVALVVFLAGLLVAAGAARAQDAPGWRQGDCSSSQIVLPDGMKPAECAIGPATTVLGKTCVNENYAVTEKGHFHVRVMVDRRNGCALVKPETFDQVKEYSGMPPQMREKTTGPQTLPDGSMVGFFAGGRCVVFWKPGRPQYFGFRDVFYGDLCKPQGEKMDVAAATAFLSGVKSTY